MQNRADVLYPSMSDNGVLTGGAAKIDGRKLLGENNQVIAEIKYGVPFYPISNIYPSGSLLNEVGNYSNMLYESKLNDKRKPWQKDNDFVKGLEFVYLAEGGYSNRKEDLGGETNYGVTQDTFDYYNKKYKLPLKNVKNITKDEAAEVYYNEFWKATGANNIKNKAMAIAYFDAAVNHGAGNAKNIYKRSGDDVSKFLEERKKFYDNIVKNKEEQKIHYNGWMNRLKNLRKFLEENIS